MKFLYELQPEQKINQNILKKMSSLNPSVNANISIPVLQIVKDHLTNISQIIQQKDFTIDLILKGYENLQLKAKFREISLVI